MKWLEDEWLNKANSEEGRILSYMLNYPNIPKRPIDVAIIADNLDYFQKTYQEPKISMQE